MQFPTWIRPVSSMGAIEARIFRERLAWRSSISLAHGGFADGCFIEDTAVITPSGVVITRPAEESRQAEVEAVRDIFRRHGLKIHEIKKPGTLDGGDVLRVMENGTYYIGLSGRTNVHGAGQLADILAADSIKTGMVKVPSSLCLHLKTGVTYIGRRTLVGLKALLNHTAFEGFEKIVVPGNEENAANLLYVNGRLFMSEGYPRTLAKINDEGFKPVLVQISEFEKKEGGLTCLSIPCTLPALSK
jgi:dimethylargininase